MALEKFNLDNFIETDETKRERSDLKPQHHICGKVNVSAQKNYLQITAKMSYDMTISPAARPRCLEWMNSFSVLCSHRYVY